MNLTQKISQMTPKGADLAATDLIEVSTLEAGSYVTKSITGQELIDAIPLPPTGLTIGTTPIASGTNGRVLFQGTGNVLQQSSSLFWDNTNGRLGIGTTTPNQTLVVNGDARVNNLNTASGYTGNVGSAAAPFANINAVNFSSPGNATLLASASTFIGSGGTFAIGVFQSTRNVLIQNGGTYTDAGFRLDVNGTARVQGNFTSNTLIGSGTMTIAQGNYTINFVGVAKTPVIFDLAAAGNQTLVVNSLGVNVTNLTASGNSTASKSMSTTALVSGVDATTSGWTSVPIRPGQPLGNANNAAGVNLLLQGGQGTGTGAGGNILFQVKTANGSGSQGLSVLSTVGQINQTTGNFLIGTTTDVASSLLTLESTTKGFLPPRMTTTQRNAIASPAAGLMVYDTTLNVIMYYNGSMWI